MFEKFMYDDSGATTIEYGVIGSLVAVVAIASLSMMGDGIKDAFSSTSEAVEIAARAQHPADSQTADPSDLLITVQSEVTELTDSVLD